jgi:hypothetical protein
MGALFFVCPATGREIASGLELDPQSYESLPNGATEIRCPECQRTHQLSEVHARLGSDGESESGFAVPHPTKRRALA